MKIHGRWCGPNWTDGKNQDAATYRAKGGTFRGRTLDKVDKACRQHDKGCSSKLGCCRRDDQRLVARITRFMANLLNAVGHPDAYLKGPAIIAGITAAMPFRKC